MPELRSYEVKYVEKLASRNKVLEAESTDRFDAWFEMRDEFECSRTLPSDRILKIMDSYEKMNSKKFFTHIVIWDSILRELIPRIDSILP